MNDMEYMSLALRLAEKGCGWTSPNPMVGAVIVKDGQIIGQGWHEKYGEPHAERNALAACTQPPEGATMYVTLEPCCHHGKQPPCVDAVLEAGIRRVVVGSADPNPLVGGRGIQILREHCVHVTENVLREQCDKLNEVFLHFINEVCDDDGWKDRGLYWGVKVDYLGSREKPRPAAAAPLYGDYGRSGHSACRRSAADMQASKREKSGSDYLRYTAANAAYIADCDDGRAGADDFCGMCRRRGSGSI